MIFTELVLSGAYLIDLKRNVDERGYFARCFCVKEFAKYNLVTNFVQMSTSFNTSKGQIRGMHFQEEPYAETKLVRCTQGAIYDVIIDLRRDSVTFNQWFGVELSAENGKMLYIPKGFAHGYKTLTSNTEIMYMMDEFYMPGAAKEISYKDLGIFA